MLIIVGISIFIDTITDIQAHPFNDDYLLSASKDGSVRMWNILTGKCLLIFEIKASVVVSMRICASRITVAAS
jgi:WD40 repeat protein